MDKVQWISNLLPQDHGFTPAKIQAQLSDPEGANGIKELALAELLEQLASQDRYQTVSIGSTSYSNPMLMERANLWRGRAPLQAQGETAVGTLQFIPVVGRVTKSYDEYGAGAEYENT